MQDYHQRDIRKRAMDYALPLISSLRVFPASTSNNFGNSRADNGFSRRQAGLRVSSVCHPGAPGFLSLAEIYHKVQFGSEGNRGDRSVEIAIFMHQPELMHRVWDFL